MTPLVRKFALTAHITSSVGWLGAVAGFLALAIAGLTSYDAQMVRATYLSMELIGWFVIVPCSLASLLTGLIQSLGTPWGLFRHYWVLVKFLLTIGATILLLLHMQVVSRASGLAAGTLPIADLSAVQFQLVGDAGFALLVLLANTTLSVYKPWGKTQYGRRKQQEQRKSMAALPSYPDSDAVASRVSNPRLPTSIPRWVYVVGIHAIGVVLLLVVLHLTGTVGGH